MVNVQQEQNLLFTSTVQLTECANKVPYLFHLKNSTYIQTDI